MTTKVPFSVRLALIFNVLTIIGLAVVGFVAVLGIALSDGDALSDTKLNSNAATCPGTVTDILETGVVINDLDQYEYLYAYTAPQGGEYVFSSFGEGFYHINIGDTIQVEYLPENPQLSRITGMTVSSMGFIGIIVGSIFGFVGLILLLVGWGNATRNITILKRARPARAKLVHKQKSSTSDDGTITYKLTYQFTDQQGKSQKASITHHKLAKLADDALERLVYDEQYPTRILLFDTLPQSIKRFLVEQYPELKLR